VSKSILIASPNTDLGELLRLSLEESSKYDVRMARSPGAVWEIMNSVWIDIVILDTDLIENELNLFVQNLLEKQSSLRYLVIPPQNNPQHPLLAGIYPDGYVTRPFFIDDVLAQIERLIGAAEETLEPVEEEAPISEQPVEPEGLFEDNLLESFLKDDIEDTQPTIWNTDQPKPLLMDEIDAQHAAEPVEENTSLDEFKAMFLDDFLYEEGQQEEIVTVELPDTEPGVEQAEGMLEAEPEPPQAEVSSTPSENEPVESLLKIEPATSTATKKPVEVFPEVEQITSIPPEEPAESMPAIEPEAAVVEESNAISLESIPPLEPELPPAPLDLALSMPAALNEIHLEPEYLEALQQEVNAFACLVCDAAGVYAYSGELNSEDGKQIAAILRHHVDHNRQSGLAHFLNIGKPPLETLLYAVNLIDQCFLVVLYDANTPISRANTLTSSLRRRLLGEPLPGAEEPLTELEDQAETQSALAELVSLMQPQTEAASSTDEITTEEALSGQPVVAEENIELPDWAVPQAMPVEPARHIPVEPENARSEPVELKIPAMDTAVVKQQDVSEIVALPLETDVLEINQEVFEPEGGKTGEELIEMELPDWAIPHTTGDIEEVPQPLLAAQPPELENEPDDADVEAQPETVEAPPEPRREPEPNPIIDNIVFPWDMETDSAVYDSVSKASPEDPGNNGNDHFTAQAKSAQSDQTYSCVLVPAQSEYPLTGDASKHLERWMPELCTSFGWQMTNLTIQPEYMLWSIVVPPTVPTGSLVNRIREYTSQKIAETLPQKGKAHSSVDFWAPTSLTVRGGHAPSQKAIDDLIQQARRRNPSASTS
jgi:REP element-mobilizing transposase RayT